MMDEQNNIFFDPFAEEGVAEVDSLSSFIKIIECNAINQKFPIEHWSDVLTAENEHILKSNYIYRGQNKDHGKINANAFRKTESILCKPEYNIYPHFMPATNEFYRQVSHRLNEDERKQWVAFSQHHGLKTNLLDVTGSPLVALFFACYEEVKSSTNGREKVAVVYLFDDYIDVTEILNKFSAVTIIELMIRGEKFTINKMFKLLKGYKSNWLYDGYQKYFMNLCMNIEKIAKNSDSYDDTCIKLALKSIHESAKAISELPKNVSIIEKLEKAQKLFEAIQGYPNRTIIEVDEFDFHHADVREKMIYFYLVFLVFYLKHHQFNYEVTNLDFMPLMIFKPNVSFERSRLQNGFFIAQQFKKYAKDDEQQIRLIQEINYTKKIKIKNPDLILTQLNALGINEGAIYGDFDNVAKYIRQSFE